MLQPQDNHTTRAPFLTKYASERTPSPEIGGFYDPLLAMWVVSVNGKEMPLINQKNAAVELTTKTKTQQETDDQADMLVMAELVTKTDTQTEQDDSSGSACLEMATKTEAQLEHDDTSPEVAGMFL